MNFVILIPFFISFLYWSEKDKKSWIKEDTNIFLINVMSCERVVKCHGFFFSKSLSKNYKHTEVYIDIYIYIYLIFNSK